MMSEKLLTILIPVYNGEKFIGSLLDTFEAYSLSADGAAFLESCEILVINNRSEDATLEIARSFEGRLRNLRVITPKDHVPSAEENVFRSFHLAKGEYTWVLGVDDIVRFEAFPDVLEVARDGKYDIAIFNFMQSDQNGRFETACNFFMQNRQYEADLVSLTQRVGFWWLIAGFSGQIVRTRRVVHYDHNALVEKTSPIYSHVTAYLECLAGRPAAILNIQNVIYRLSDNDIDHWRRAAMRLGVFDEYFWTLGYVRQIAYLERKGIVPRDYLTRMLETNRNSVFRPTAVIYDKLLSQLITMAGEHEPRNRMSRAQFEELVTFLEKRDLLARPFLSAARELFDILESGTPIVPGTIEIARWRLQCYQSSFPLAANCVGVDGDYEIYELCGKLLAVHRLFRGALLDRVRYLDHTGWSPVVFEGKSRGEIARQIAESGLGMDFEGLPASVLRYCSIPLDHGVHAWNASAPPKPAIPVPPPAAVAPAPPPPAPVAAVEPAPAPPAPAPQPAPEPEQADVLRIAQWQLRDTYKNRNGYPLRVSAWVTNHSMKVTRWLARSRRGEHGGDSKRAA